LRCINHGHPPRHPLRPRSHRRPGNRPPAPGAARGGQPRAPNPAEGLASGIWECEPGKWRIAFGPREHEYFIVLEGLCRVHDAEGHAETFGPGQAVFLPPGFEGAFEVIERVRKHFVIAQR
jgi:uncharacterized cupin superfamily protein